MLRGLIRRVTLPCVSVAFCLLMQTAYAATGEIVTFAGSGPGSQRFSGDGGLAPAANLYSPSSVAADSSGNLYIADTSNNRVRKVNASGVISTVAGSASGGFSGDGGLATAATLMNPNGVAVDSSGNLYIADTGNNRIRRVSTTGVITTVAGNGEIGDQDPQPVTCVNGGICVGNPLSPSNPGPVGDGGQATAANLYKPIGVAIDPSGNLYIADTYHDRIRKVKTSGVISTVAGNGNSGFLGDGGKATAAELFEPSGVAVSSGNLYIADTYNHRIRKVNSSGGISTVAGNGNPGPLGDGLPATAASLYYPNGVAVDAFGNLYIADTNNHRIRKVNISGVIATVGGTGNPGFSGNGLSATAANLYNPSGVAIDAFGNLYIADTYNHRIRKVNTSGVISTVAGDGNSGFSGDGGQATAANLYNPSGVAIDSSGNLYIADTYNHRIRKVNTSGVISTVAGDDNSGFSGDGGQATAASLYYPNGVTVDSSGNLYIADTYNQRIRKVNTAGVISTVAGNGNPGLLGDGLPATAASLSYPLGVAIDSSGNLYIADTGNDRIRKVDTMGLISTVAGGGQALLGYLGDGLPATAANLNHPSGVAVDSSGNLYIADTYNGRIRKVNTIGVISAVAGGGFYLGDGGQARSAMLNHPSGVAVDSSGNLYIADTLHGRVRKVRPSGVISTVAGNGSYGFLGDGAQGALASLGEPRGVTIDSSGGLFIVDTSNNRIRRVV